MGRFVIILGVVIGAVFFVSAGLAADIENLIMNGGGEWDENNDGIPDKWGLSGGGTKSSVQRVNEPKTEGKYSVRVNLDEKNSGGSVALPPIFLDMPLKEDSSVIHLKMDIRFESQGCPGVTIRWPHGGRQLNDEFQDYNYTNTYFLKGDILYRSGIKPSSEFKTYEMFNKFRAGTQKIPSPDFNFAAGAATIYIDNVQVFIEKTE